MPCYTLLYLVGLVQNNHLQTNRKKDWRKKGQINGKAGSNSHPSIQPARQTARQPDRQTNTQTNSETYLPCLTQASEMRLLWKRSDEVFFVILLFCYYYYYYFFYHVIVTVQACGDCACSCTVLGVVIGVLVVIIIALAVYILWFHKKGEQYSKYSLYLFNNDCEKTCPVNTLPGSAKPPTSSYFGFGCK